MTMKPQKRDNAYYLERLRDDHPAVYADFQAGKFKNAAEAFIAAGLRKTKSGLDLLRSAWSKATPTEQTAFKALIGCAPLAPSGSTSAMTTAITPSPIGAISTSMSKQALPGALEIAVRSIMVRRRLKTGAVMREMGMDPLDASLGMALNRGTMVQEALVVALEKWVKTNSGV